MCLAIPGRVIDIFEENGLRIGRMDFAGVLKSACLEYVPEIRIGQYAVVHAGFAIGIIDEKEAEETAALWQKMQTAELSANDVLSAEKRASDSSSGEDSA
jgi:hydrogenase expression/formation protein HypC